MATSQLPPADIIGLWDELQLHVAYVNAAEETAKKGARIEELFPGHKVHIAKFPMNICCHVGPGTIGTGVSYLFTDFYCPADSSIPIVQ